MSQSKEAHSPSIDSGKADYEDASPEKVEGVQVASESVRTDMSYGEGPEVYRLFKRRFVVTIGVFVLSLISGMNGSWFGPIANATSEEFGIGLGRINWLSIAGQYTYLPVASVLPYLCGKWGIRRFCDVAAFCLLLSAWVRFAGTARGLSSDGEFALLLIGQILSAVPQATFQIIGPKVSENWFDLGGRTTATMIMAIANPIGGALGQLISPMASDPRAAVLLLGIISTVAAPLVFIIQSKPAVPPTFAATRPDGSMGSLIRAMLGKEPPSSPAYMQLRERIDFTIISLIFAIALGASYSFAFLSSQMLAPHGYTADEAGFMGATLLGAGVVVSLFVSPLFDRWLTHRIGIAVRILAPVLGASWLVMIWVVRADNAIAIYVLMVIIGACGITLLPLGLELGVELTRNAEASAALIWMVSNTFGGTLTLIEGELRAGENAKPPFHLQNALILQGVLAMVFTLSIFALQGNQGRKAEDEKHVAAAAGRT